MSISDFEIQAVGLTNYFEINSDACKLMHILNINILPYWAVHDTNLNMFQAAVHGSV